MFYDSDVATEYLSTVPGIWLPPFAEAHFSGLAGLPDSGALPSASVSIGGDLWNNNLLASDSKVYDKALFDFVVPAVRRSSGSVCRQAGHGVWRGDAACRLVQEGQAVLAADQEHNYAARQLTIMNNVIDPTKGERTRLNYVLADSGPVTVTVFTLAGDIVKVLQRGKQVPGDYTVNWDGRNLGGAAVARGMYFIRVVGPGIDEIRKVMVVKQ